MVNVGSKTPTIRKAVASGRIEMREETLVMIEAGNNKKGVVLGTARIAGIMAAKRTAELVPLCHPIPLSKAAVEFDTSPNGCAVVCKATVETVGPTGVEMEALTACAVAALTVYDMCKSFDQSMAIEGLVLLEKSGGRSGLWRRDT